MLNALKQQFKLKLANHTEFTRAWVMLKDLGYVCHVEPYSCQYIYTHTDGTIGVDYFDIEGADLSNPNTALGYYQASLLTQITFDDLVAHHTVFKVSPPEAYHWERLPNGKCIWHCRKDGKSSDKTAPDFDIDKQWLWRDFTSQQGSEDMQRSVTERITELTAVIG